jgi:hypothetical protein
MTEALVLGDPAAKKRQVAILESRLRGMEQMINTILESVNLEGGGAGGGAGLFDAELPRPVGNTPSTGSSGKLIQSDHVHLGVTTIGTSPGTQRGGVLLFTGGVTQTDSTFDFYDGSDFVFDVTIVGSLTGTTFTLNYADLIQASIILVHQRGVLKPGYDFSIAGATLTMLIAAPFEVGDPAAIANANNFWVHSARRS